MSLVPVTDWAVKTRAPVKGKEKYGTVIEVGENIYHRVNHATEDKGQPPMSARACFAYEAPE